MNIQSTTPIRRKLAGVVANLLTGSPMAPPEKLVDTVQDKLGLTARTIKSDANGPVEKNFEEAAKVIAGTSSSGRKTHTLEDAMALKERAPEAVDAFGNHFIFGFGSMDNHSFQSYGDGVFSFRGGNMAQKDVLFVIDTTPGEDNMVRATLDYSKLPESHQA